MSHAAQATGIGKRYSIKHAGRPRTLVDAISSFARAPLRRLRAGSASDMDDFWALRDVNFSIPVGQAVGVIGRNGAGKSTLLKILSRVTEPTEGRIELRGRVASLIEVGTGFHHELSGRENIFLNGAILGMRRHEIAARLEQIVEFAGVSQFLEEPIKHYSSGMYMRLAFAVAAFLESEILIVDEVLAVGDLAFQEKCLGTMNDAAKGGRTLLFVSHNMAAIAQITTRTLLLDGGRMVFDGPTPEATQHYIGVKQHAALTGRRPVQEIRTSRRWRRDDHLMITEMGLAADQPEEIASGGAVRLEIMIQAKGPYDGVRVAYTINGASGQPLMTGLTPLFAVRPGTQLYELTIRELNLVPGEYDFSIVLGTGAAADQKLESDSFVGFGRLRISQVLADGRLFGNWHNAWGQALHGACGWRQLGPGQPSA